MAGATNQQQSMSPKDMFIVTLFQHLFMTVVSCFLCYSLALKIHSYYLLPPEEERWEEENRFSAKNIRIRIMFLFNLLRSWHHLRNIIIGRIITPLLYLLFLPLTLILKGFLQLLNHFDSFVTNIIPLSFRAILQTLHDVLSSKLQLGTYLIGAHNYLVYNIITPTLWPFLRSCIEYLFTCTANRGAIFSGSSGITQMDNFYDLIYILIDIFKQLVNTVFYALPVACFFVITLLPSHLINEEGVEEYLKTLTTSLFSPEESLIFRVFKISIISFGAGISEELFFRSLLQNVFIKIGSLPTLQNLFLLQITTEGDKHSIKDDNNLNNKVNSWAEEFDLFLWTRKDIKDVDPNSLNPSLFRGKYRYIDDENYTYENIFEIERLPTFVQENNNHYDTNANEEYLNFFIKYDTDAILVGVLLSGLLFGLAHNISRTYIYVAWALGMYLSLIYLVSGDLILVMLVHSLFDITGFIHALYIHTPMKLKSRK